MLKVMEKLLQKAKETASEFKMIEKGDSIMVAFSGGADSTALLALLTELKNEYGLTLFAAHLNHGLREAADNDEKAARRTAEKLGAPFVSGKAGPPPDSNVEAWARESRYDFLEKKAIEAGASRIAVAHTADDSAETMLINLVRGAGLTGLSGIAPVRESGRPGVAIIRPLIRATRTEIIEYLEGKGLPWVEDESNRDPRFVRNRIRNEVMPVLESMNPAVRETLARTAEVTRRELSTLREAGRELLDRASDKEGTILYLDAWTLMEASAGLRAAAYREAVEEVSGTLMRLSAIHLDDLDGLVMKGPPNACLDLPGLKVLRLGAKLAIGRPADVDELAGSFGPLEEVTLAVPGSVTIAGPHGTEYRIEAELVKGGEDFPDPSAEAWLVAEVDGRELIIRPRREGDRYTPAGTGGTRKLKNVLNELKVPAHERDRWPIFELDGEIVWVPGVRPSQKTAAHDKDEKVVAIRISPPLVP